MCRIKINFLDQLILNSVTIKWQSFVWADDATKNDDIRKRIEHIVNSSRRNGEWNVMIRNSNYNQNKENVTELKIFELGDYFVPFYKGKNTRNWLWVSEIKKQKEKFDKLLQDTTKWKPNFTEEPRTIVKAKRTLPNPNNQSPAARRPSPPPFPFVSPFPSSTTPSPSGAVSPTYAPSSPIPRAEEIPEFKFGEDDWKEELAYCFNRSNMPCDVVTVSLPTGYGKSTELPFSMYQNRTKTDNKKIVYVTMSKRLPTESLVRFLRDKNTETRPFANDIDFRHGGDRYYDQPLRPKAKLLFVSEGWLLTMLMMKFNSNEQRFRYLLDNVEAVIMDEVHERTTEGDFMCAFMRHFLRSIGPRRFSEGPRPKLVLMSATLCPQFPKYFEEEWERAYDSARQSLHIENVHREEKKRPDRTIEYWKFTEGKKFEDECVDAIKKLKTRYVNTECVKKESAKNGNILVFLPSIALIKYVADKLWKWRHNGTNPYPLRTYRDSTQVDRNPSVIELHGQCEPWVRDLVQREDLKGRVILATNIVESGITISNLVAAVDSCLQKNKMEFENANSLMECYATKSALTQREGRVSRGEINAPRGGMVIRMIDENVYDRLPCPTAPPQVLLTNILGTYVKIRSMDMGDIRGTKLMSTIKPYDLRQASSRLQELGVLDYDDNITPLGKTIQSIQTGPLHATAFLWCLACIPQAWQLVACSTTILAVNAKLMDMEIEGCSLLYSVEKNWKALSRFMVKNYPSYDHGTISPGILLKKKDLFENYGKFSKIALKLLQQNLTSFIPKDPTLLRYLESEREPIVKMQYIYLYCFMPQLMIWCNNLNKYINLETDQTIKHVDARDDLKENKKQARVVCYLQMEYVESKSHFTAHHTFALTANMIAFAQQHNQVEKVPDTYAKSILMSL